MLLDQSPEHPRREAEQPDGRGGRHGRGAGAPVEQGDLSEEVSGAEPGPGLAAHAHRRRPFRDEEEPHSPVALARDYVALGMLDLLDGAGDGLEFALRAAREHGHLRQPLGHLSRLHGRRIVADLVPGPVPSPFGPSGAGRPR